MRSLECSTIISHRISFVKPFLNFFSEAFFASVLSFFVSLERSTIIPRPSPFVNTFFRFFSKFFCGTIYSSKVQFSSIYSISCTGIFWLVWPYSVLAETFLKSFFKNIFRSSSQFRKGGDVLAVCFIPETEIRFAPFVAAFGADPAQRADVLYAARRLLSRFPYMDGSKKEVSPQKHLFAFYAVSCFAFRFSLP